MEGPPGGIFGFLDSKHLLALRTPAKGMPTAFETLDLQGQVVDTWTVPKHWTVADISPERGLLAILTDQATKTLVVDHTSKKVILARDNPPGFEVYAFLRGIRPLAVFHAERKDVVFGGERRNGRSRSLIRLPNVGT